MDVDRDTKLRIFLGYADEDVPTVNILYNQLVSAGYAPWLDKENVLFGQIEKDEIEKAIRSSDAAIICLSSMSLTRPGEVHQQLRLAQEVQTLQPEGSIFLIPILLDNVKPSDIPLSLMNIKWGNYKDADSFEKIVRSLNNIASAKRGETLGKLPKSPVKPTSFAKADTFQNISQLQSIVENIKHQIPSDYFFEFGDNPQIVREIEIKLLEARKLLGGLEKTYTSKPSLAQTNLYYDVMSALEKLQKFVKEVQSKPRHAIEDTEHLKEHINELDQALWRLLKNEQAQDVINFNAPDTSIIAPIVSELGKQPLVDVVILTVLGEEYNAICKQLENLQSWSGSTHTVNLYAWKIGTIKSGNSAYVVCVGMTGRAGNNQSALATNNAIALWNPSYVFFSGIAGGLVHFTKATDKDFKPDIHIGDIVIGDIVHGYEYGKIETDFIPRDDWTYSADQGLWTQAVALKTNSIWRNRVKETPPQPYESKVVEGQIASGDKVVDNPTNAFFAAVLKRWPKVKAVEMEGAGIGAAINHARDEKKPVGFLMVRGISDIPRTSDSTEDLHIGDGQTRGTQERDQWKKYAADVSAAFTAGLIAEGLPLLPKK